tara:strand:+ start:56 stop:403 length:348 start_codon:yes stop_codon:yes gene_type:complete
MDLRNVNTMPMADAGMNDLQVVEDQDQDQDQVQVPPETEEEESLVYEETDETEQQSAPVEGGENTISILGFELQKDHLYMLAGLLVILVAFFYKDQLMEIFNDFVGNKSTPAPLV